MEKYDITVIGAEAGGLFASAILAKRNLSVLILKEKGYKPFFEKYGYRFEPFSNLTERSLNKRLIRWVYEELGLSTKEFSSNDINKKEIFYQIILPENRIDIINDFSSFFEIEMRREFEKELGKIINFYDNMRDIEEKIKKITIKDFPQDLFPVRKACALRRLFSSLFREKDIGKRLKVFSEEFKNFIILQLFPNGNLIPYNLPTSLTAWILMNSIESRVPSFDIYNLNKVLMESINASGVRIEEVRRIERIERKSKKGFIIKTVEEEKEFESRYIIVNHPIKNISYFNGEEKKRISKWKRFIEPYYFIVPFFLGIREKVIPVGMKDLVISLYDLRKPFENGNLIYFSLSPKDGDKAPTGKRALVLECLIPFENLGSSIEECKKYIISHLGYIIPFLEDYIDLKVFEWAENQLFSWSYPHFIYKVGANFDWREGIVPNQISRNLFFIGKENFPYLGLEGELIGGYLTAKNIISNQ